MKYNFNWKKVVFDIETTNLLQPMIDFTKRPLQLKEDAQLWCIALRDLESKDYVILVPEEYIEEPPSSCTPEQYEIYKKLNKDILSKEIFEDYIVGIDELIGHNIIGFDLPALKLFNMLDYEIEYINIVNDFKTQTTINGRRVKIRDTSVMSTLAWADRPNGHSLEAFGKQFGNEKIDFNKFHCFSAEMIIYCIQDVNVNVDVYNFVLNELLEWGYNTAEIPIYELPYLVEAKISDLILKQGLFGFDYDMELSQSNKIELDALLQERAENVNPNLPPKGLNQTESKKYTPPARAKTKTGALTAHMKKFLEKHNIAYNPMEDTYEFEGKTFLIDNTQCIKESLPATIKDLAHLKSYLIDLGWQPTEWSVRDLSRDTSKKLLNETKFLETVDRYVKSTFEKEFTEGRLKELSLPPDITREEFKTWLLAKKSELRNRPFKVPTSPKLRVGTAKELCPHLEQMADKVPFIKDVTEYYTYQHRRNSIGGSTEYDEDDDEATTGYESQIREDGRISTFAFTNSSSTTRMRHIGVNIAAPVKQL